MAAISASVSFDPGCAVVVTAHTASTIVEAYCLGAGTTIKDFALPEPITVDSVSGNLSFFPLNWPWWKTGNTAICGAIGSTSEVLLTFDFQSRGKRTVNLPVYATFPRGITLDVLRFNLYPDLTLPTDFRAALVFTRLG